jgi:hypothetical protein
MSPQPIPPFRLVPEPLDESAAFLPKFRWAGGDIGLRHRLGGAPEFIQHAEWPDCPACRARMTFYAQLDSINDDFCIADCGMIYVFLCFERLLVETVIQSH